MNTYVVAGIAVLAGLLLKGVFDGLSPQARLASALRRESFFSRMVEPAACVILVAALVYLLFWSES